MSLTDRTTFAVIRRSSGQEMIAADEFRVTEKDGRLHLVFYESKTRKQVGEPVPVDDIKKVSFQGPEKRQEE